MLSKRKKKRFHRLLKKYLAGKATESEIGFVETYYGYFDRKEADASFQGEEAIWTALNERIDRSETPVIPLYRKTGVRIAAAAAIVLLIAGSYWYFEGTQGNTSPQRKPLQADVAPGGNKATITLAGGQTITLDSAANGDLARQGQSTIVKQASGEVAYVALAGAAAATTTVSFNTLTTPIGGQYKITLPDGTKAWLNSASSLRYPTAFTGKERRVVLTGEAYFEVSDRARQPFVVDARGTTVQVLGTHFDVMAYTDEPAVNTTLVEGKVRVTAGTQSAILELGQKAIADNGIRVVEADTDKETAWIDGFFQFDETDLPTLMRQLKRWYGIEPVYDGNGNGRLFGGRISRNLNLSQVLQLLEGNGIHFTIEGKRLIIINH